MKTRLEQPVQLLDPEPRTLAIVVPCFNEEEVILQTHDRISDVLSSLEETDNIRGEIIYVNDGSRDRTLEILHRIQAGSDRVRLVSLSRNFGHQIAVSAGIDFCEADAVVIIDADLQDPPELIKDMLDLWRQGYRVVYAQRSQREGETRFKLWSAYLFYRTLNWLSDVPIPQDTGDFRLIDREVVTALRRMPERARFLRGMVSWVGFNQIALPYDRQARAAGETKYPLSKMLRFAFDGILSFSTRPLRLAIWLGLLAASFAVLGILYAFSMRILTDVWVSGWTLLFIAVLFMGGVQLLVMGVIGEYLGRLYEQTKNRPLYLVDQVCGFDTAEAGKGKPT